MDDPDSCSAAVGDELVYAMGAGAPAMTKDEFCTWLDRTKAAVYVWPYDVAPCRCGDVNCKGWRLVPAAATAVPPREQVTERVNA